MWNKKIINKWAGSACLAVAWEWPSPRSRGHCSSGRTGSEQEGERVGEREREKGDYSFVEQTL